MSGKSLFQKDWDDHIVRFGHDDVVVPDFLKECFTAPVIMPEFSKRLEPAPLVSSASVEQAEKCVLKCGRDRSARTGADRDPVHRPDRRDFRRGSGEEDLIGDIEHLARYALFPDWYTEIARQRQDRVAGDAWQHRRLQRWRVEDTVADHEQVLAAALADHNQAGIELHSLRFRGGVPARNVGEPGSDELRASLGTRADAPEAGGYAICLGRHSQRLRRWRWERELLG